MTGKHRAAVFISTLWMAGWFLFLWNDVGQIEYVDRFTFVVVGVVPVAFLWGLGWVVIGFRREPDTTAVGNRSFDRSAAAASINPPFADWKRVLVVAYALFTGAVALLFVMAAFGGARNFATSLIQASFWLAIAIALLQKDKTAPTLLWVLVGVSGLGMLMRGLVPLDMLFFGLNLWFTIWYGREVKRTIHQGQGVEQLTATGAVTNLNSVQPAERTRATGFFVRKHENGWAAVVLDLGEGGDVRRFLVGIAQLGAEPLDSTPITSCALYEDLNRARLASDRRLREKTNHPECSELCLEWIESDVQ